MDSICISQFERNKQIVSAKTLQLIAKALNVDIVSLI
ncbi:MAG: helix-turn-helix transcriptional regulator [Gammaproteobacteria bacterium]|nr:helix-turn-helix transcriptional regulator [Gammaproteobacteria bacterium]